MNSINATYMIEYKEYITPCVTEHLTNALAEDLRYLINHLRLLGRYLKIFLETRIIQKYVNYNF